jgi:hypothetical protein
MDSHPVQKTPVSLRIYEHGMHLAEAMRKANLIEQANDLEIWVLGMVHELEEANET